MLFLAVGMLVVEILILAIAGPQVLFYGIDVARRSAPRWTWPSTGSLDSASCWSSRAPGSGAPASASGSRSGFSGSYRSQDHAVVSPAGRGTLQA